MVKVLKLVSGEYVIANIINENDQFFEVDCTMIIAMDPAGHIALIPDQTILFSKDNKAFINKNNIVSITDADKKIIDNFEQACQKLKAAKSGLVIASGQSLPTTQSKLNIIRNN